MPLPPFDVLADPDFLFSTFECLESWSSFVILCFCLFVFKFILNILVLLCDHLLPYQPLSDFLPGSFLWTQRQKRSPGPSTVNTISHPTKHKGSLSLWKMDEFPQLTAFDPSVLFSRNFVPFFLFWYKKSAMIFLGSGTQTKKLNDKHVLF